MWLICLTTGCSSGPAGKLRGLWNTQRPMASPSWNPTASMIPARSSCQRMKTCCWKGLKKHQLPYAAYCSDLFFSSVQFCRSVVSDSLQPHESQHARPPCPSPRSSLKLMSLESVMASSHLILCRPLFLLPPIPPSIRVFSNESTLRLRWPKYWSFSFSIIPSKEHPGLISFRMDWL